MTEPWLTARRGEAPLIVSFPHSGLELPSDCTAGLVSTNLARHDTDRYVDRLHVFAHDFGATTVYTALSRRELYFAPYHAALAQELARLRGLHKRVVLYDSHSIRSVIPRLFPSKLPVFNIGTNDGEGCDSALTERIAAICAASRWSHIVDGRFKGGWITRTYGRPADGIHAVQMEVAMRAYLSDESDPPRWDNDFAKPIQQTLRRVFEACLTFARA